MNSPNLAWAGGTVTAQLHVADGQDFADPTLTFRGQYGANFPINIADTTTLFDGNSVPSAGTSRAGNGALWDIHTFDLTSMFSWTSTPHNESLTMSQTGTTSGDSLVLVALLLETASVDRLSLSC